MKPSTAKRRRPKETGTLIGVRLQRDELALIDAFIRAQEIPITRPEAVRRLLRLAIEQLR